MKDLGNPKFEDSWKEVFSGAEAKPDERVWTNIDLQLSRTDNNEMRQRVIFYQRLIAASVFLALLIGGGVWYATNNGELDFNPASRELASKGNNHDVNLSKNWVGDSINSGEQTGETISIEDKRNSQVAANKGDERSSLTRVKSTQPIDRNKSAAPLDNSTDIEMVAILSNQGPSANSMISSPEYKEAPLASLANADYSINKLRPETLVKVAGKIDKEIPGISELSRRFTHIDDAQTEKHETDNWVASIGGSSGGYSSSASNSNFNSSSLKAIPSQDAFNAAPSSERESLGNTYSVGMTVGKKISPRWLIASGFNYMNQSIDYKSNIAVVDAGNPSKAFIADLALESSALTTTSSYTLNSVNEFFSIPIQVGYLIVNRKIGFQLNTGMAADFFVRNKLADEGGILASYTDGGGKNSSYRTVNWAGLLGTELSYKVAKHYRVSLVPGLRYSFTSVLRPSTGSTLRPFAWDLGFRFGYIF